jgi:hypothetical protein
MLGESLAAQPEHETISVKRIENLPFRINHLIEVGFLDLLRHLFDAWPKWAPRGPHLVDY